MIEIVTTRAFDGWFDGLSGRALKEVTVRLERLANGNPGDAKSLRGGLYELRFRVGLRVYYAPRGRLLVLVLGGGDKASQPDDIAAARALLAALTEDEP